MRPTKPPDARREEPEIALRLRSDGIEETIPLTREILRKSIGEEFAELRAICAEEGEWELPVPVREDRRNPFAEVLEDVSE